jgi:site-specific DNA recombinase
VLSNEKYKGDALLQKSYSVDFLTKKRVENKGEVQQYYVEDSHPAIIDKEMWEAVQLEMERRRTFIEKYGLKKIEYALKNNIFSGRAICGHCGSSFGRKIWNSTDERLRRVVWRCNRKYAVKGKKSCDNKHIDDSVLYKAFINTFNAMIENMDYFMENWKGKVQSENVLIRYKAKQFIKIIEKAEPIKEFDMDLFFRIVEKMSVFDGKKIIVTLLDGTEVECVIE